MTTEERQALERKLIEQYSDNQRDYALVRRRLIAAGPQIRAIGEALESGEFSAITVGDHGLAVLPEDIP